MAKSGLSAGSVAITGLFHDLTLKPSTVSIVRGNDPEKRLGLPVPYRARWMIFRPRPKNRYMSCLT